MSLPMSQFYCICVFTRFCTGSTWVVSKIQLQLQNTYNVEVFRSTPRPANPPSPDQNHPTVLASSSSRLHEAHMKTKEGRRVRYHIMIIIITLSFTLPRYLLAFLSFNSKQRLFLFSDLARNTYTAASPTISENPVAKLTGH
jgi:hypothetical protein